MTTEVDRIRDQLRRAFQGEAWHGPSLMELISDIDAARAAAKPLPRAHSIWEIVLHVAAWEDAVRRRIEGEAVELSGEKDWPPVRDPGSAAWKATLDGLKQGHEALDRTVSRLDDAKLLGPVPGRDYTVYFLLHGVIQHDLYHAGQIAVLRKG
jgi:uncharacterized damage-inducible protein DinB